MQISFVGFTYQAIGINGSASLIPRSGPDVGGFFEVLDPDGSRSDFVELFPSDIPRDDRIIISSDPDVDPIPTFPKLGTLTGSPGATGWEGSARSIRPPLTRAVGALSTMIRNEQLHRRAER